MGVVVGVEDAADAAVVVAVAVPEEEAAVVADGEDRAGEVAHRSNLRILFEFKELRRSLMDDRNVIMVEEVEDEEGEVDVMVVEEVEEGVMVEEVVDVVP